MIDWLLRSFLGSLPRTTYGSNNTLSGTAGDRDDKRLKSNTFGIAAALVTSSIKPSLLALFPFCGRMTL